MSTRPWIYTGPRKPAGAPDEGLLSRAHACGCEERSATDRPGPVQGHHPSGAHHHTADDLPSAVLFDRDGTLVVDVPYNGDPARVVPMPTARAAVDAVRARGVAVGVVSNQSGVARGLLTRAQVEAVQRRVEEVLGPFGVWAVCPHGPEDGCGCRKPAPGLVLAACARLGVDPARSVVIGDIAADLGAARAAGARGILVPTPATRPEETAAAPETAPDLLSAVRLALGGWRPGPAGSARPPHVSGAGRGPVPGPGDVPYGTPGTASGTSTRHAGDTRHATGTPQTTGTRPSTDASHSTGAPQATDIPHPSDIPHPTDAPQASDAPQRPVTHPASPDAPPTSPGTVRTAAPS